MYLNYDLDDDRIEDARREAAYDAFLERAIECAGCGEHYDPGYHRATRTDPGYYDHDECPACGCSDIKE